EGARSGAVQDGVAGDDAAHLSRGLPEHDLAPREGFADVVLSLAIEDQPHARQREGAEALPRHALERQLERARGKPFVPEPRRDEPGSTGTERPLPVAHDVAQRQGPLMSMLEPIRDGSGDRLVDRTAGPSRPVVPVLSRRASASLWQRASVQQAGNVEAHALRGGNALAGPQVLPASDELRDGAGADPRQLVPHGLGKVHEEAHDVVRVTGEAPAQLRVLRRDAHRTGVEVTLAQHGAAQRDEGRGAEPELFCAERGRDDDVTSRLQTAVHAQGHAATEVVLYQRTLNVDEPQLPRLAGVLDAAQGTGSGAAVVARDLDVVGIALGHAR